jgi:hypothetical protein
VAFLINALGYFDPTGFKVQHHASVHRVHTCLNAQTGGLEYATYLGGSSDDYVGAIAVDSAGSVYVVGQTTSHDFPLKYAWQSLLLAVAL